MKTNEAPKKIYLDSYGSGFSHGFHTNKLYDNDIEYISTDAFIEKAVKFMEKIDDVDEYSWYNEEEHAAGITEKCIEDFKSYMKGE